MTMLISSHQPSFFPWAGYWNKVANSDLVIISAGVKLDYGGYQNRVGMAGTWWTIPVRKGAKDLPIKDVRFDRAALPRVMKTGLQAFGGKRWRNAELVRAILADTEAELGSSDLLLDLNMAAFSAVAAALGIRVSVHVDLNEPPAQLSKTERLVSRLAPHAERGDVYLSGNGSLDYLDEAQWPDWLGLMAQHRMNNVDSGTVLQLIAIAEEPLDTIEKSFAWREVNVSEHTGHRAALG
jgi:hypothetical protein